MVLGSPREGDRHFEAYPAQWSAMTNESVSQSATAARLAALVKRSAEFASEMKATSEKMEVLTKAMSKEAQQRSDQAAAAKRKAGGK